VSVEENAQVTERQTTEVVTGLRMPEGFRWHDENLYFVDMQAGDLLRSTGAEGDPEVIASVDGHLGGIGWLSNGELLAVEMHDRHILKIAADGSTSVYADVSALTPWEINDLTVDPDTDRVYVGTFGFDALHGADREPGEIYCIEPDGSVRVVADNLQMPNKSHILADGRTLIVGETWGECITAFDIAPNGDLTNRRPWAAVASLVPDGSALDVEGGLWVANLLSAEFVRIVEGGEITERIPAGEGNIALECALGGPDGTTLFLGTATSWDPEVTKLRLGQIRAVEVDIAGLPRV
jgi:sugar lactone lactonase YvrE